MQDITVNVFPGGFNWGVYVAEKKGLFAANGLRVSVQETPNSVTQMTDLSTGACDIAMTAIDNIVAYVEGQGEAPIGPQAEFFAFMGSDTGFLNLVSRSGVTSIAALRGRTVSVDAMTTGYAFVLFEILRRNGLAPGDYKVARAGGMVQRWTALRAGEHDATLLSTPYNILARSAGFIQLARGIDVLGHYQGNVAAARRSWARDNKDAITGYVRAYTAAIEWLYDRANCAEAAAILRDRLPHLTAELAELSYAELLDKNYGFFRDGHVDAEGVRTVLELRNRYATPVKPLVDPARYFETC